MSVKNAAITSVTVTTVDIHRRARRGCKTLMALNDKYPAAGCANPCDLQLSVQLTGNPLVEMCFGTRTDLDPRRPDLCNVESTTERLFRRQPPSCAKLDARENLQTN